MRQNSTMKSKNDNYGYVLIGFFTLVLYIINIGFYVRFNEASVPLGDPFTYTYNLFRLLDLAHENYWGTLKLVLTSWNWYWLYNIPVTLLSPILIKEPFSISLVNFIMYGLASASFYRLARHLKFGPGLSFLVAMIIWIYPVNYGFATYSSISVLGLDSMFTGILYVSIAQTLIFALDPSKLKNAIIAGIATGVAIWGRGNSIPVVGMQVCLPVLFICYTIWKNKSLSMLINLLVMGAIVIGLSAVFYITYWEPISTYYSGHGQLVTRQTWNLNDAMPYLKNIPGFMFWRAENSIATMALSGFFHLFELVTIFIAFGGKMRLSERHMRTAKILAGTGGFIYFVTFFVDVFLFSDPLLTMYNSLLIWRPMLTGITLSIIFVLYLIFNTYGINVKKWAAVPMMIVVLINGVYFTKLQTPKPTSAASPQQVETFVKRLDELLKGGTFSMIWYQHYNPNIIRYYRVKNNLPDVELYMNTYFNDIWTPLDYSDKNRKNVRWEIEKHFEEASVIVIPEFSDKYYQHQPYAIYKFRDEIVDYLNSGKAPRLVVRWILHDTPEDRLLVLQREEDAGGEGEPIKLPYGPSTDAKGPDYSDKVERITN
jgi:hypothetical protein